MIPFPQICVKLAHSPGPGGHDGGSCRDILFLADLGVNCENTEKEREHYKNLQGLNCLLWLTPSGNPVESSFLVHISSLYARNMEALDDGFGVVSAEVFRDWR